jgi:hypothetical protein
MFGFRDDVASVCPELSLNTSMEASFDPSAEACTLNTISSPAFPANRYVCFSPFFVIAPISVAGSWTVCGAAPASISVVSRLLISGRACAGSQVRSSSGVFTRN